MLTGVLLHVVAAAQGIDQAPHWLSGNQRCGSNVMNGPIFFVRDIQHRDFGFVLQNENAGVMDLSAAGGIKSCPVQHDCTFTLVVPDLKHARIEGVEEGIVVVKTVGHWFIAIIAKIAKNAKIENQNPATCTLPKLLAFLAIMAILAIPSRVE